MCQEWNKPKQGIDLSITCSCGKYCIRKNREGSYTLLERSGATWRDVGFKTAEEAKARVNEA